MHAVIDNGEAPSDGFAALGEEIGPLSRRTLRGQGAVVAQDPGRRLVTLKIPSRFAAAVGPLEELIPVNDGAEQIPDVDKVKRGLRICPILSAVFDLAAD